MSKAFTKDDDGTPPPPLRKRGVPVPTDVPNYITADGERALRVELANLPAGSDERAHEISEHLATAIVMEPPADRTRAGFGATVTLEDETGKRVTYRLVGAIEASPKDGAIYWQTPIAEELEDAQVGDSVTLPKGEYEVVAIEY
jgi:transcription elongation GreA/GreB family factor